MPVSTVPSAGLTSPLTSVAITTLNTPSGVLATQNGMTGICKAWVNYNGSTQTIIGSFNVSSVTYNALGDYTVNFTTAMPDTNYSVVTGGSPFENPPATWNGSDSYSGLTTRQGASSSASSIRVLCYRLRFDTTGVAAINGFANMIAVFSS